ncbi:MAG: sulfatase-like hydrolase/transferase [Deltaproteobacteria bacterium]
MKCSVILCRTGLAAGLMVLVAGSPVRGAEREPVVGQSAKRPNLLLILTDDQRWDTIRALGNPEIHTPNLDRLVECGFRFNNAYCMGAMVPAVCLPSRTMLITGRSLWRIPVDPRAAKAPAGVPLLPNQFNAAGYRTFHCGKSENTCTFGNAAFQTNITVNRRVPGTSRECADHLIKFLNDQDAEHPFFAYFAPPVPHDPRVAPTEFVKLYEPAKLALSKNSLSEHPFDNGDLRIRDELLAAIPRVPAEMRQHLADYYAAISNLDHELGRVFEALQSRGLADRTIVVFSSDQGLAVGGRHGLMGKQNLYEHVKPPLILSGPGIPHGQSNALCYLFDLFPTLCELAGIETPDVVEGKSLLPVIAGKQPRVREWLLGAYRTSQRMIRDERWKLIKYNAGGAKNVQLFDLRADPDEVTNLADDPKYAGERARLEKLLTEARREFGDPVDFEGSGTPGA